MEWSFKGYKIKIRGWKGRLGNNLVQLMNAIFLAKQSKSLLEYPYHEFIRHKVFDFRERGNKMNCGMTVSDPSNFFYLNKVCPEKWKMTLQDKRDICRNYIRKLLTFALPHSNLKAYKIACPLINWETTLVIHMRSGDVYRNNHVHPDYPQPPLSFYTEVIKDATTSNSASQVLIVSEKDGTNPCISALKEWCKENGVKCYSQSNTIQSDAATLLNAKFLVTTRSSFSEMLALCSKKCKRVYIPYFFSNYPMSHRNYQEVPEFLITRNGDVSARSDVELDYEQSYYVFHNYIKRGDWRYTQDEKQRNLVLNYPKDSIEKFSIK